MTVLLWVLLAVGLTVHCMGIWGRFGSRKLLVMLGAINIACAGTLMILRTGSDIRFPAIVGHTCFLIVLFSITLRSGWQSARWTIGFALATILGLFGLLFLSADGLSGGERALVVVTGLFAAALVAATLAAGYKGFMRTRESSSTL